MVYCIQKINYGGFTVSDLNKNECTGHCDTCKKCTVDFSQDLISEDLGMTKVEVFDLGDALFANVESAVASMGPTVEAIRPRNMKKYGKIELPAIAVNGKVVSQGKVLSVSEATSVIMKAF